MNRTTMRLDFHRLLPIASFLLLTAPYAATAQEPEPVAGWMAALGLMQFELDGTGLAPMVALRGGTPLSSVLLLEGSMAAARPEQTTGTSSVLIPEAQLQLSLPFTSVSPYMGLGAGAIVDFKNTDSGGTQLDLTISGAVGLRVWIGDRFGLGFEFRGRGIGADFERNTGEYIVGGNLRR
ncbi:MAG: hypothetical protein GEU90_05310 [Gemmatimonas sp.]|nr:hypothetical protein [Gemmatimonas sp.]